MRTTNARGNTEIYMPKDKTAAVNKLAELSALAATRDWERAALVSLLVKSAGVGRPKKSVTSNANPQMTINEFTRLGVYGFRTHNSVRAYLKAWKAGGMDIPVWGQKTELPSAEFPDFAELYGREVDDDAPAPDAIEDSTDDDGTEDEDEAQDVAPSPRPTPTPRPQATVLDRFLEVLDKTDPTAVVNGQDATQVKLLIKTLESWLESLQEAAAALAEDDE
jgi:hypothetical protein